MPKLPHVSTYKYRWVRRTVIVLTYPLECGRALVGVWYGAKYWWKQP